MKIRYLLFASNASRASPCLLVQKPRFLERDGDFIFIFIFSKTFCLFFTKNKVFRMGDRQGLDWSKYLAKGVETPCQSSIYHHKYLQKLQIILRQEGLTPFSTEIVIHHLKVTSRRIY
jgi:hypothetical protein